MITRHRSTRQTLLGTIPLLGALAWTSAGLLHAQNPGGALTGGDTAAIQRGFQFYELTGSVGYTNTELTGTASNTVGTNRLKDNDTLGWVGARFGWSRPSEKSNISIIYSPFYFVSRKYPDARSLNHSLQINTNTPRKLTPKLTFDFSVNANIYDAQSFVFSPVGLSGATLSGADFSELSTAFTRRSISNDGLVTALNGGQFLDSPARVLFGNRTLSFGGRGTLTYNYSKRLSIALGLGINRTQTILSGGNNNPSASTPPGSSVNAATPGLNFTLPYTTSGTGSVQLSYAHSTRLNFTVGAETSRSFTRAQDAWATNTRASVGYSFQRWFLNAYGGVGAISPVRLTYQLTLGPQYIAGGSVGIKTRSHVFIGNVDRVIGDQYGIGSFASLNSTASWFWGLPGRSWGISAGFGQQRLLSTGGASDLTGYRGNVTFFKRLGLGFSTYVEYAHLDFQGTYTPFTSDLKTNSARVGISWSPHGERAMGPTGVAVPGGPR